MLLALGIGWTIYAVTRLESAFSYIGMYGSSFLHSDFIAQAAIYADKGTKK